MFGKCVKAFKLAWHVAFYQLWRMKLRTAAAAMIVAAPLTVLWATTLGDQLRPHNRQVTTALGCGDFPTRLEQHDVSSGTFQQVDDAVQTITNNSAVGVVMNTIDPTFETDCPRCSYQMM